MINKLVHRSLQWSAAARPAAAPATGVSFAVDSQGELAMLWFFDSRLSADRVDLPFGDDSPGLTATGSMFGMPPRCQAASPASGGSCERCDRPLRLARHAPCVGSRQDPPDERIAGHRQTQPGNLATRTHRPARGAGLPGESGSFSAGFCQEKTADPLAAAYRSHTE